MTMKGQWIGPTRILTRACRVVIGLITPCLIFLNIVGMTRGQNDASVGPTVVGISHRRIGMITIHVNRALTAQAMIVDVGVIRISLINRDGSALVSLAMSVDVGVIVASLITRGGRAMTKPVTFGGKMAAMIAIGRCSLIQPVSGLITLVLRIGQRVHLRVIAIKIVIILIIRIVRRPVPVAQKIFFDIRCSLLGENLLISDKQTVLEK